MPYHRISDMRFHEKLANALKQSGIEQAELARRVGGSAFVVGNWVRGKFVPPFDMAVKIAQTLNLSLDYLGDDGMEADPRQEKAEIPKDLQTIMSVVEEIGPKEALRRLLAAPPSGLVFTEPGQPPAQTPKKRSTAG